MPTVLVDCTQCSASGIFYGMFEPDGVGRVCGGCKGKGYQTHTIFQMRRIRDGIDVVREAGDSEGDEEIPYNEFLSDPRFK